MLSSKLAAPAPSGSGQRSERLGAPKAPPKPPGGNTQEGQPEQEARTRLREKKNQRQKALERAAEAVDGGIAELHQDRRRGRVELSLVLFGQLQIDGGEVHAMLQGFLFRFHLLDFAAHAGNLLLHIQNVLHLAGPRTKNILKAQFRFLRVLQPRHEVEVLLSYFFASLCFSFNAP